MSEQPLDALPIWGVYALIVLVAFLTVEVGFRLGRYKQQRTKHVMEASVGSVVGATLALLAFFLVFLTGAAADRFDTRRELVVTEANAINRTYLRAGYLEEPYRSDIRQLLREYVDVRLEAARDPNKLAAGVARSEEIHREIWDQAEVLAVQARPNSDMVALFIESLNDVIDVHTERVVVGLLRIPTNIWTAVFFIALLTIAMVGFQNGVTGNRVVIAQLAMIMVFAGVILLIVDLDRSQEGFLQVSQQAIVDLQRLLRSGGS
ncbi:MAG: hypothetical protein OEX04_01310 [Acidimicrobiia bacterium]|nr:hypothetical protein [Acidimicrobiia bacterium]MDH4306091.1 hypothetical protein [Acidimicrobiia bacterium]MDH5292515.1 hypothetical protein [Acidimicrobiia bacterium]